MIDSLKYCQQKKGLILYGYVIMTNHVHLLFSADESSSAEIFMRDFKKWQNRFQLWQANNFPEIVESRPFFRQKLEYIHLNPVKKGFVNSAEDWKYSSARNWMFGDHSMIKVVTMDL